MDAPVPIPSVLIHNPACSKSRAALALLLERGIHPQLRDYLAEPLDLAGLARLKTLLGLPAHAMLRVDEPEAAALGLPDIPSDEDALAALAGHPRLLQRPIFVMGGRAVIGRPPERVLDLL